MAPGRDDSTPFNWPKTVEKLRAHIKCIQNLLGSSTTGEVRSGDEWVTGEVGMGHWVGYWGGGDGLTFQNSVALVAYATVRFFLAKCEIFTKLTFACKEQSGT